MRKLSIFVLFLVLVGGALSHPKKANAVLASGSAVFDVPNTAVNAGILVIEKTLKLAVVELADSLIEKVSNDIVSWANNGFDGQPGFINNYGELVEGIEIDVIGSAFNTATSVANTIQQNNNTAAEMQFNACTADIEYEFGVSTTELLNGDGIGDYASIKYDQEYGLARCKIDVSTNSSVRKYNDCVNTNDQAAVEHAVRIVRGPTQQFFDDFFDGNASIDNEYYADFNDSERLSFNNSAQTYYEFMYKRNQCYNNLKQSNLAGDAAQIAESNDLLNRSGKANSSRAIATTVADFGTQKINDDKFKQLAEGGGDLLLAQLGSQGRKDDFKNDITAGGWDGMLALTGEGSTDLALRTTAIAIVGNDVSKEKAIKEAALALPTKILDKTKCVEYEKDSDGAVTEKCVREVAMTPGDVVAEQLVGGLQSDQKSLENFGDDLALSLINSLGSAVANLTNQGLAKLTNATVGSFFNSPETQIFTQESSSGGDFQSQYNVLGITPGSSNLFTPNDTQIVADNSQGGIIDKEGIGGPEDPGARIIINLQNSLEKNLDLAKEEKAYFEQIRDVTIGVVDAVYEFDRCIPGPDYGWEDRFGDHFETNAVNQIARNETASMVNDPQVTIPGGVNMKDQIEQIFQATRQGSPVNELRKQATASVINSLSFIQEEIQADFNVQKQSHNANLVLFKSDWNKLTMDQQQSALEHVFQSGYYINPTYVINNATEILAANAIINDNDKVRDAVIQSSWDIWRTETPSDKKTSLRENYYILESDLSNSRFVTQAKAQLNALETNISNSYMIALDCMVFKAYALGQDRLSIANIVNQDISIQEKIAQFGEIIQSYNPKAVKIDIKNDGIFNNTRTGDIPGFNVKTARTDNQLKTFLENEGNLQLNGGNSVLMTKAMTVSSVIQASILGFASELEKQEYFDTYYPESWITHNSDIVGNKLSVSEIYEHDIMRYSGSRGQSGLKGALFCRIPGYFDRFADNNSGDDTSKCFQGSWYPISKLDLQLIVSEINN